MAIKLNKVKSKDVPPDHLAGRKTARRVLVVLASTARRSG